MGTTLRGPIFLSLGAPPPPLGAPPFWAPPFWAPPFGAHFGRRAGQTVCRQCNRDPTVCAHIVDALHAQHPSFHLAGVHASGEHLAAAGFHAPSWQELAAGARPEQLQGRGHGTWTPPPWVNAETEPVHGLLVEGTIRPGLSPTEQALFRSQGGPLAGVPYM